MSASKFLDKTKTGKGKLATYAVISVMAAYGIKTGYPHLMKLIYGQKYKKKNGQSDPGGVVVVSTNRNKKEQTSKKDNNLSITIYQNLV